MNVAVIISRLPTERSVLALAMRRAGFEAIPVADPISGLVAIAEHEPALAIIGDTQVGVDTPKVFVLLAQHFPTLTRGLLTEDARSDPKSRYRAAMPQLVVQLPLTHEDLNALVERVRRAFG